MREIIFDTETTGLDNKLDRVIEIGGVELENHFPTGRTLHLYINPGDRKVHPDALAVHGITDESLKDKPSFADVVEQIPLRRHKRLQTIQHAVDRPGEGGEVVLPPNLYPPRHVLLRDALRGAPHPGQGLQQPAGEEARDEHAVHGARGRPRRDGADGARRRA